MEQNQKTLENSFKIHTSAYEGPFELALELIEKRKLLVNDISLASITDSFIQYVQTKESFPVEETTNFIGIAATLLLIKSKSLIPSLTLSEEESEDVADLKQRLVLYEKTREAARVLGSIFGITILFSRGERRKEPIFTPSRDLSPTALSEALLAALAAREESEVALPEARVQPTISLEEMMEKLATRVQSALTLSFRKFSEFETSEKIDVILSFLALLELVKQGAVEAAQYEPFDDIRMTNTSTNAIPRYDIH